MKKAVGRGGPREPSSQARLCARTRPLHLAAVALILALSSFLVCGQGTIGNHPGLSNVVAYLNGTCELPSNNSSNLGIAVISYDPTTYNPTNNTVVGCKVSVPPEMAPTSAAIYGPAGVGQNAPLLLDLGQAAYHDTVVCVFIGPSEVCSTNVQYYYTNSFTFTPQQMADLISGRLYVNVTSADYSDGEVRGQFSVNNAAVLSRVQIEAGGGGSFWITGQPNAAYEVQASTDLASWIGITNVTTTNSLFRVSDPAGRQNAHRFYRVRLE